MSVEQQVETLATSVDELKAAVVTKKAILDATVVDAQSATAQAQAAKANALSARDQAGAFKDAAYSAAQSAASAVAFQDLTALAAEKAVTALDVFIYDTSKDSDGGAWRHRCAGTSWFNEPLNTATRGARRDFPAVAVIVAEVDKVTIYDGDDPALPMWRVWSFTGMTIRAVDARDNKIVIATSTGLAVIALVSDRIVAALTFTAATSQALVSANCNDVAMTVLPDAPIDPATGLPVPTIAVATDGGVSVIKDDGTVVDLTYLVAGDNQARRVVFLADAGIAWSSRSTARYLQVLNQIPASDYSGAPDRLYVEGDVFGTIAGNDLALLDIVAAGHLVDGACPGDDGVTFLAERPDAPEQGMVAYTTSIYATGWLPGDIRGAFLSDISATDLVDGSDADRSVNNNPLTVNGTITRAPVASGAELVEYRCGASDWLSQDFAGEYNGQSTFALIFWAKGNPSSQGFRWFETAGGGTSAAYLNLYFDANTGQSRFVWQGRQGLNAGGDCPPHNGQWAHHVTLFEGGSFKHYQNGVLQSSSVHGITAELHELRISPVTTAAMALFRISNTIPTPDQIRRIYEDEKVLFQENAACTLYGASDAVTALAHDPDTGLLHVGTSAGRSVFKGLRRVANTTVPVGAAIAAAGGMVVEE